MSFILYKLNNSKELVTINLNFLNFLDKILKVTLYLYSYIFLPIYGFLDFVFVLTMSHDIIDPL